MFRKILIATHNKAKLKELNFGLARLRKFGIELFSLTDLKITAHPEETGRTFQENSALKARFYSALTELPAIADDGGLVIPLLNNEPGVKSKRWLGYDATDEELIKHTLFKLRAKTGNDRRAYLETCLSFHNPETKQTLNEQEKIEGHIAEKPNEKYLPGFPYRALFIVDKFNKYYDELTPQEHHQINHRLLAINRLISKIKPLILK